MSVDFVKFAYLVVYYLWFSWITIQEWFLLLDLNNIWKSDVSILVFQCSSNSNRLLSGMGIRWFFMRHHLICILFCVYEKYNSSSSSFIDSLTRKKKNFKYLCDCFIDNCYQSYQNRLEHCVHWTSGFHHLNRDILLKEKKNVY